MKNGVSENVNISKSPNIVVLNQPIDNLADDKIGLDDYVDSLECAIEKGANVIGIEADFGTGKSSLISLLKRRRPVNTKIISVNLWHIINDSGDKASVNITKQLHKSFLYQAVSSKDSHLGSYISRRLSSDYGLLSLVSENKRHTCLSKLGVIFIVIAFFKDIIKSVLSWLVETIGQSLVGFEIIKNNEQLKSICKIVFNDGGIIDLIQVCCFVVGLGLIIFVLCSGDIVFSSAKKEGKREIDDTVIVDLFRKEFYRKEKGTHYIFVIEDLDRTSDMNAVESFIKELRRYYFIEKNEKENKNNNTVTFIVCIKPETLLNGTEDNPSERFFYTKVFDYIISLPSITGDNKEAIICGLLGSYKKELCELNLIKNQETEITMNSIKGLHWVTYGRNASIRDIKNRLNQALLTYKRAKKICDSLNDEDLFQKCAAAVYFKTNYESDFIKLTDEIIDLLLDGYVIEHTVRNTADQLEIDLSEDCMDILDSFIQNKLLDHNFRCYFYNIPNGSKVYNARQLKIYNGLVYNEPIHEVQLIEKDLSVINDALSKRNELNLPFPEFVVEDKIVYSSVVNFFESKVIELIENRKYDVNNISSSKAFVLTCLTNMPECDDKKEKVKKILEALLRSVEDKNCLIEIRKEICKSFKDEIINYSLLFEKDNPFITEEEVQIIENCENVIRLMNFGKDKSEINEKSLNEVHSMIVSNPNNKVDEHLAQYFYENVIDKMGLDAWNNKIFEWLCLTKKFPEVFVEKYRIALENEVIVDSDYVAALGCCEEFTENAFALYSEREWSGPISANLSGALYKAGYFIDYIIGEIASSRETIDFESSEIKESIREYQDYLRENETEKYQTIRKAILKQSNLLVQYDFLFSEASPITEEELNLIVKYEDALMLLEKYGYKKCFAVMAKYFSSNKRNSKATYEIIKFIMSMPINLAKEAFYDLDMNMFSYSAMSKKRREEIEGLIVSKFEIDDDVDKIIKLLTFLRVSIPSLESELSDRLDKEQEEAYVTFANSLDKVEPCTLNNILKLKTNYVYSDAINEKLFEQDYYITYISSKVRGQREFRIEEDRREKLWKSYVRIFNMSGRIPTQKIMRDNHEFVDELIEQKEYLHAEERIINYSYGSQTKELLEYLFSNFKLEIIVEYLKNIYRFKDKDAAHCFVQNVVNNDNLLFDDTIYGKCYDLLIDPGLKGWYTRRRKE
ncbi:hypothetical protein [Pseudobutyrivibrio sp.]|uniref:hypothetical protein n=1 Tax=Pseudobutyrivibrio sp. TaxID=2014367 RepID=UPI0025D521C5|nr:hypothetical protein [Pseudobutyrivibrio sp.]MBR5649850.1 hypothetical protein [Pseudobutyrivibrio sp.]